MTDKEKSAGAAGIFSVPVAVPYVAQVFEEESALDNLENFLSINGARFYNLPINSDTITLQKISQPMVSAAGNEELNVGMGKVEIFRPRSPLHWAVI